MKLFLKQLIYFPIKSKFMRTSLLLILCNLLTLHATVFSQNKVTMKGENISLKNALVQIEQEAQVKFVYRDEAISDFRVSFDFQNSTIEETLQVLLRGTGSSFHPLGNNLIVISPVELLQGIPISGTVTDNNGESMPGVNVVIKGTIVGQVTDMDGRYTITVPSQEAVLAFSFIGYAPQEIIVGTQRNINITLSEDTRLIDEVVVTAFGIKRQARTLTYATQTIDTDQASEIKDPNNFLNALQGKVSNALITQTGSVGSDGRIIIRGNSSINGSNNALIVIDGVPSGTSTDRKSVV